MASGIELLNRATPGLKTSGLGTKMNQLITLINELRADMISMGAAVDGICAKLDSDAGVTDTNYAAVHATGGSGAAVPADPTASAVDTLP